MLFSASRDKTIRVWNSEGECKRILDGHTDIISHLVLWNKLLFSASYDSTVREWNDKGECMAVLKGHEGVVLSMCVWRGHLFTGGCEEIKMWISKTPTELESSPFTKHHHHHH